MLQDARYAIRAFAHSPGFTAAAVLSLALGIGANTAIFSVASALLLRPLPYAIPSGWSSSGTVRPGWASRKTGSRPRSTSTSRPVITGFEQVAIAIGGNDNLTGGGEPERIGTIRVSSNLLPMLGARAAFGRLFVAADDSAGAAGHRGARSRHLDAPVRRRSARDRHVPSSLNGQPYQIVGVLPASLRAAARGDADLERRRGRRDHAAAAARAEAPPSSAAARTTTSSAS